MSGNVITPDSFFRALVDATPRMVGVFDGAATVSYANKRWCTYTGTAPGHRLFHKSDRLFHPDDAEVHAALFTALQTISTVSFELRLRRFDDVYRWHEIYIVPLADDDEGQARWMFTCSDIEDQHAIRVAFKDMTAQLVTRSLADRAMTAKLREQNRLMTMAEQIAKVGHWRFDLGTHSVYWSEEVYRAHGYPPTQRPSFKIVIESFEEGHRERVTAYFERAIADGTPFTFESRIVRPDGSVRDVLASGQADRASNGKVVALFGILQDITERKAVERERERLAERISVATKAAQVGIWDWDIRTGAVAWDAIMFRLFGFLGEPFEVTYDTWTAALHPDDLDRAARDLAASASDGTPFDTEFRAVWPNGEVHNIRAMAVVVPDANGAAARMIGTNWDITEARTLADALRKEKDAAAFAAAHDTLTGLLNRRGLEAWIRSKAGLVATLLYLDIDGFKAVNDRGGHAAGDETLRCVARIIQDAVREADVCARIGGDEFVVVLLDVRNRDITMRVFGRITHAVDSLRPLGADDDTRIGMSIGIGNLDGTASSLDALNEADADLYRCKAERKALAHTPR
jgi:diguanylate cyclase (GGDEF)-like protein/PAS domain S-box-containing protein